MLNPPTAEARVLLMLASNYRLSPITFLVKRRASETKSEVFEGNRDPTDAVDEHYGGALSWALNEGHVEVNGEYNPTNAAVDALPYYRLTDKGWETTEPHLSKSVYRIDNTVELTHKEEDSLEVNPIHTDAFVVDEVSIPSQLQPSVYTCGNIVSIDPPEGKQFVVVVSESSANFTRLEDAS